MTDVTTGPRELRRKLEELKETEAFLYLNQLVQSQVDQLQQDILFGRCPTIDSALEQEYKKGQLDGKLSWQGTLEAAISNLDYEINNLNEELKDGSEQPED